MVTPIILDYAASYAGGAKGEGSALLLPLVASRLLDYYLAEFDRIDAGSAIVVPCFAAPHGYAEALRAATARPIRVVDADGLQVLLSQAETADYVVVTESRRWLAGGMNRLEIQRWIREYRGATHVAAVGANVDAMREQVECGADGDVRRVLRLYDAVNWPEVGGRAAAYSVAPARALAGIRFTSIAELRAGLAARGTLSRDVPVRADLTYLDDAAGYLAFHERLLSDGMREAAPAAYSLHGTGIWVAPSASVAADVRIVPPVVIQEGACVAGGATIVGPVVIGEGARIGQGATIVQAVVAGGAEVPNAATVRHRIAAGPWNGTTVDDAGAEGGPLRVTELRGSTPAGSRDLFLQAPVVTARRQIEMGIKRMLDVVLSALALIVLAPWLIAVAILIKLDSRGPVFFIHHRERRGGARDFPCLKFRTMVVDAHRLQRDLYRLNELDGPQFKLRRDPRVTRVGWWLRGTNIDEMPQLINVLLGHMSIVGPRPSPFRENQVCVAWRRARLSVRPGITGLWQLCRGSDRTQGDFHEWIFYDMAYVRHFSLWLDLKIMAATLLTLGGRWSVPMSWMISPYRAKGDDSGRVLST